MKHWHRFILIRQSQNFNRVIISFNVVHNIVNCSLNCCILGGIIISNCVFDFFLIVIILCLRIFGCYDSFVFFSILVACSLKFRSVKKANSGWVCIPIFFQALHISQFRVFFSLFIATIKILFLFVSLIKLLWLVSVSLVTNSHSSILVCNKVYI